jgi:hypothetical protein
MAAIRVQLVKYLIHLPDGTVWSAARGARRIDHSMAGDASHVCGHSGPPVRSSALAAVLVPGTGPDMLWRLPLVTRAGRHCIFL